MSMETIDKLYAAYGDALTAEYDKKIAVEEMRGELESLKAHILGLAREDGEISGKNKDTRDQQRAAILDGNPFCIDAEKAVVEANYHAVQAEIKRKVVEAQIGLTKAFWYSQSGKP